jgi:hypothetical protein
MTCTARSCSSYWCRDYHWCSCPAAKVHVKANISFVFKRHVCTVFTVFKPLMCIVCVCVQGFAWGEDVHIHNCPWMLWIVYVEVRVCMRVCTVCVCVCVCACACVPLCLCVSPYDHWHFHHLTARTGLCCCCHLALHLCCPLQSWVGGKPFGHPQAPCFPAWHVCDDRTVYALTVRPHSSQLQSVTLNPYSVRQHAIRILLVHTLSLYI